MAQKPLLWVEVGAHAVRNRSKCGEVGGAGAGVAWCLGVCVFFEASWTVWRVVLPRRGLCAKHCRFLSGWCEGHGPLGGFHIMGCLLVCLCWRWRWRQRWPGALWPRRRTPPHRTLTCCAPHAHPLLPTAMAFVPYGFVLVKVQVHSNCFCVI